MKLEASPVGDSGGMAQVQMQLASLTIQLENSQNGSRNEKKCGVPSVGLKAITRMNAQHSHGIWNLEHRIHYQEGGIVIFVRNGDIIQMSVNYYKNISVHQGTCFPICASHSDMKKRVSAHSI
jgi:hypothetical protein